MGNGTTYPNHLALPTPDGQSTVYMTAFDMRSDSQRPSGRPQVGRRQVALPGILRARWTAILLAALLAFSWQSFVTQTHVHFGADAHMAAVSGETSSAARHDTGKGSPDTPANCPICEEIAHNGLYLLPILAVLEAPEPAPVWQAVTALRARAVRKPSHVWRSRAPPISLQA